MISIFTTAWDRPEFAPKYNKFYIFWQRSYLLCFSFVLKLLIFKQSRWPLKRRTHFLSDSYSAGEVSRIRQLSLFQESENWIWVCEGNINIWPVQNGELAWQKESSFFPSKYSFRICLEMQTPWGLCWKMESSNFWRNAISFMSPISLAAIEWCKTNLCATYIRQNLSNVSNMWTKTPNIYTNIARIAKAVHCHSQAVMSLALMSWFQFSNVSLIVNNVTKAVNFYTACVSSDFTWRVSYLVEHLFDIVDVQHLILDLIITKKGSQFWLNLLKTLEKCLSSWSSLLKKGSCECNSICEQ